MAYLDRVCTGLDNCIPRKLKQKEADGQLASTRAKLVYSKIEHADKAKKELDRN